MICRYERTIFENPANGWRIASYKTKDNSVPETARNKFYSDGEIHFTAVGCHLPNTNTIEADLQGQWEKSKYGMQYTVSSFREIIPKHKAGIIGYLSSGLIKGVGEKTAKAIVDRFGTDTLEIIENTPEKLLDVKGITEKKLKDIVDSYSESKNLREIMTIVSPFGISAAKAAKIQQTFGTDALNVLKQTPFRLCEITGFGFKTVDEIARKTGCKPDDPLRIRGAVIYALDAAAVEGHLFLEADVLCQKVHELLNAGFTRETVSNGDIRREADIMRGSRITLQDSRFYKTASFYAEKQTAEYVSELLAEKSKKTDVSKELIKAQSALGLTLSPKQAEAVKMCFNSNISIVTGGPGTGKTTILKVILEIFRLITGSKGTVLLAAPTGRAGRRMTESTGFPAGTLHSALGLVTDDDDGDYMNSDEPLDYSFVIVDEFSMVDMRLASELFSRIRKGTRLLLVGDADQLPSVGAGNVFREFISCGLIPVTVLDVVFRQSDTSRIALNAQYIRENQKNFLYGDDFTFIDCETDERAADIIREVYMREVKISGVENVQILSPFKKRGGVCVNTLNEMIRGLVNPKSPGLAEIKAGLKTFRMNDKVMQIKNKYEISNGDIGKILNIYKDTDGSVCVSIGFSDGRTVEYGVEDMNMIEHAYAVTIHKSQGSEYQTVIIPMMKSFFIMLRRNLIYTAVTRAKQKVILVGQKQAAAIAVGTDDTDRRNTMLAERIRRSCSELLEKAVC